MKRVVIAVLATLAVGGCAENYYGPYGGGGLAYYDDYYGPYGGGYWGPTGVFYYRGGDRRFHADDGHHFRHDAGGGGFHGVRGQPGFHGWHGGGGRMGGGAPGAGRSGGGGGHDHH